MKPYSYDLRIKILSHFLSNSAKETARVFNVSVNTVYLLKRLFIETGDVKPRASTRKYPRLISPEGELYLQVLIIEKPDITLEELRDEYRKAYAIPVSMGTMFNTLKKLGFSYKKNLFRPSEVSIGGERTQSRLSRKNSCNTSRQ